MPFWSRCGYLPRAFSTVALMIWLLMFGCLLKAARGGLGKTFAKWQSFATIDRQCLAIRFGMEGSLGSYAEAKTGLLFSFFLATFLRSFSLGTFLALFMADSTISCWYPLSRRRSFNSSSLLSLSS